MNNLEALGFLEDFYNGQTVNARDVSTAFFIVACALPADVTMDDMKDFVLNGSRNWEQRRT